MFANSRGVSSTSLGANKGYKFQGRFVISPRGVQGRGPLLTRALCSCFHSGRDSSGGREVRIRRNFGENAPTTTRGHRQHGVAQGGDPPSSITPVVEGNYGKEILQRCSACSCSLRKVLPCLFCSHRKMLKRHVIGKSLEGVFVVVTVPVAALIVRKALGVVPTP